MKRGLTALTSRQHFLRALKALNIKPKTHAMLAKNPGAHIEDLIAVDRLAYGSGESRKVSVLLVPELRKRRSERDPVVLAQQIKDAGNRLADIKAARVAAQ